MGRSERAFKHDKFKKSRGGYSRWLLLSCAKCDGELFAYQKDGAGILKRLYLDRIHPVADLGEKLICKNCKTVLGIKMIYKKEKRPAYRLFAGAVQKKMAKGDTLPKWIHDL